MTLCTKFEFRTMGVLKSASQKKSNNVGDNTRLLALELACAYIYNG